MLIFSSVPSVLRKANRPLSTIHDFALEFADLSNPDAIRATHALDVLADIYSEDNDRKQDATKVSVVLHQGVARELADRASKLTTSLGIGSPC